MEQPASCWTNLRQILCREVVTNMYRENSGLVKIGRKTGTLHEGLLTFIAALVTNFTMVAIGGTR